MSAPPTDRPAEAATLPNVGEVVAQRYQIERFIARGGMSHVFAARHAELGSALALKVLDPGVFMGVRDAQLRFAREARLASQLKHPSIVEVFDVGVTEAGLPFIAMELLNGDSLSQVMVDRGPMPWPMAQEIMLQILDALQVAHSAGAIHRDIKPDNCLVVPETLHVKLLDFGIARVLHETQVTVAGRVMGTPHYLSPEQARGAQTDVRTDVYSAGIVLYEMLTGHCPFEEGTTFEIVGAHVLEPPPPLSSRIDISELPAGLPELLDRVLAKEPDTRPPNAGSFAAELRALDKAPARGAKPAVWLGAAAAAFVIGVSAVGVAKLLVEEPSTLESFGGAFEMLVSPSPTEPVPASPAVEPEAATGPESAIPEDPLDPDVIEVPEAPEVEVELEVEPEEPGPASEAEPVVAAPRRRPSRRLQVARKIRRAVSSCARFAPPGGAKVSLRAVVKARGTIRGVQLRPPYAGSVLGRCVAKAVGKTKVGRGAAITFDQSVLVGG
ncbi:MAG: serine/threonine-protein kinase [Nannocystales bacterium]